MKFAEDMICQANEIPFTGGVQMVNPVCKVCKTGSERTDYVMLEDDL